MFYSKLKRFRNRYFDCTRFGFLNIILFDFLSLELKKKIIINDSFLANDDLQLFIIASEKKKCTIDFILTFFQIHFFQAIERIVKNIFAQFIFFISCLLYFSFYNIINGIEK